MTTTAVNRRTFIKDLAAATAGLSISPAVAHGTEKRKERRRTNLLLVLADQWRFSAFGHGSDPLVRTPHFDRLAEQGARWTRAYAANPLCTPNRSAITTGRFPHQTSMITNSLMLPPAERCISHVFGEAGYATHYIGKWHMDGQAKPGFVPPGWRRRGFGTFEGFNRGHFYYKTPTFTSEGERMNVKGYEPTLQTDLAIQFMKRNKDRPFFCYLSWGPPHMPYKPPKRFDRFKRDGLEWRPNVPAGQRKHKKTTRELAGYYGLCESLDHELGRLLRALDELRLADNTLVVFTSDHGDMHGSHGKRYKGHPEEESLHIPLLMRCPARIKAGQTPPTLVSSIDLMPTLLSVCGLETPSTCTGRDLSAAVLGERAPAVQSIYAEGRMHGDGAWRAIVTPRNKLAVNTAGKVTHLFDLAKDPYEMKNLADEKAQAKLRTDLLAKLHRWAKDTGDPFPEVPTRAKVMYAGPTASY